MSGQGIEARELLVQAAARLPGTEGRHEAELLLLHVLQRSRGWLFAHPEARIDDAAVVAFNALVDRRAAGEPVAYLLGWKGFWTLDLEVGPATLIPRPETELLVELALARLPTDRSLDVADLGTGSGAIALALASERPRARVTATDLSADALVVAHRNAQRNGLGNVSMLQGAWFAPLAERVFDLVTSNPPYIAADDPHLAQGDLRFEPPGALASGADGLDDIRIITAQAPAHLRAGGWLLLEHGWDQGDAVRALLQAAGFTAVETARDLEARDRVSLGQWPGAAGG